MNTLKTISLLMLLGAFGMHANGKGGGGGGGHGGGHVGHGGGYHRTSSYYYVTTTKANAVECPAVLPFSPNAGIYLPQDWATSPLTCGLKSKRIFFYATNPAIKGRLTLSDWKHESRATLPEMANMLRYKALKAFTNPSVTEIESLTINGRPAERFSIQGITIKGVNTANLITLIQSGDEMVQVQALVPAETFADNEDTLKEFAYQFHGYLNENWVVGPPPPSDDDNPSESQQTRTD